MTLKAFNVDSDDEAITTDCGISTVPIEAHKALDEIIAHMITQRLTGGGESLLKETDSKHQFRLTFCNFTNLTICPHCHGTGAQELPQN